MNLNKCNNGGKRLERVKVIAERERARKEGEKKEIIEYKDYKIILES